MHRVHVLAYLCLGACAPTICRRGVEPRAPPRRGTCRRCGAARRGHTEIDPSAYRFSLGGVSSLKSIGAPRGVPAFSPDGRAIGLGGVGVLAVVDAETFAIRPALHAAAVTHSSKGLYVFSSGAAMEVDTGAEVVLTRPKKGAGCSQSFSSDGRWAGLECVSSSRDPCSDADPQITFDVVDVTNGVATRHFEHPIDCSTRETTQGTISESGHFVVWRTREATSYEDLRKPGGPGPTLETPAELSPDDALLFATRGRYSRGLHQVANTGPSPAQILDPRNGRALLSLDPDVVRVVFSPSSRLVAAVHASIETWTTTPRSLTVHSCTTGKALLSIVIPGGAEPGVAFSPDDRAIAVTIGDALQVYRTPRP